MSATGIDPSQPTNNQPMALPIAVDADTATPGSTGQRLVDVRASEAAGATPTAPDSRGPSPAVEPLPELDPTWAATIDAATD